MHDCPGEAGQCHRRLSFGTKSGYFSGPFPCLGEGDASKLCPCLTKYKLPRKALNVAAKNVCQLEKIWCRPKDGDCLTKPAVLGSDRLDILKGKRLDSTRFG